MFRPRISAYPDSASCPLSKSLTKTLNELADIKKLAKAKEEVSKIMKKSRRD